MNDLETARLRLRVWENRDRPAFHRLNSDERVMRFFPYRRSRAEADRTMDAWNAAHARTGLQFHAVERLENGETVGMVGLAPSGGGAYPFPETVQIGWRLLPEACGRGYATEAASACLRFGFDRLGLPEIVSYCCVGNVESERVMQRIGLRAEGEFDHPSIDPATHPHLRRHKLYRLAKTQWEGDARSPSDAGAGRHPARDRG